MKVIIKFLKFLLPALCLIFFCGDRAFAATLGDLNDDGYINSSDYTLLRRYLLNLSSDINSGVRLTLMVTEKLILLTISS